MDEDDEVTEMKELFNELVKKLATVGVTVRDLSKMAKEMDQELALLDGGEEGLRAIKEKRGRR